MIIPPYVNTTPHYQHDCDKCTYLGTQFMQTRYWDIYFCNDVLGRTIIIRYDDKGSCYTSCAVKFARNLVDMDLMTRELFKFALEKYDEHENYCEALAYDMYAI